MAISFPNYLQAALYNPDYSGVGDVMENYYKGKAMPKDDLLKQIQAQFARPNAEASLAGTRLSNESLRLGNAKSRLEQQQNAQLEAEITKALRGVGQVPAAGMGQQGNPAAMSGGSVPMVQQPGPDNMASQEGQQPDISGIHPDLVKALMQMRQQPQGQQMPQAPQQPDMSADMGMPQQAPAQSPANEPEAERPNPLQVITQGEPRLASIDALYDRNPLSRQFLEKKGFTKKTEVKFDPKTGQTRILTTYPSGKVTLQLVGSAAKGEEGIPLTNAVITQHQKTISAIDNAIPTLEEIKKASNYPITNLGAFRSVEGSRDYADYQALVGESLDKLISAFNLPRVKESIETVKHMVERRSGESDRDYKNRIDRLIKKLEKQKNYSASEVKRSNKIQPVGRSDSSQPYSSDEWEPA